MLAPRATVAALRIALHLSVMFTLACARGDAPAEHPRLEIPAGSKPVGGQPDGVDAGWSVPDGATLRNRLAESRPARMIPSVSGSSAAVIGSIVDIAVSPAGRVYALDPVLNLIHVVSFEDRDAQQAIGDVLSSPWFRNAVSIEVTSSDELYVGTPSRIAVVSAVNGLSDVRLIPVTPEFPDLADMCVRGSRIIVRSATLQSLHRVHAISPTRGPLSSFVEGYTSGTPATRATLSTGGIACTDDPPMVIVAFKYLPLIEAYDTAGARRWISHLVNFRAVTFTESTPVGGRTRIRRIRRKGDNLILSLTSMPHGAILLQVAHLGEPSDKTPSQRVDAIDTYLLSARDGTGSFVGSHLPHVMSATTAALWTVDLDPLTATPRIVEFTY
jgi:hypothetical protein